MKDGLVNIRPDHLREGYNFWEFNMQLTLIKPFSELYKRDKTKNKTKSTKEMVSIFLMSDPDSEINKFYRIPYEERLSTIKETYFTEFNENDELIKDCLDKYPYLCMSPVKRALKEEIDTLVMRAEVLRNSDYTLDSYLTDDDDNFIHNASGQLILVKGTATQLDNLRSKTTKLFDDYAKLEEKFIQQKGESRVTGGRKRSKSEKKEY